MKTKLILVIFIVTMTVVGLLRLCNSSFQTASDNRYVKEVKGDILKIVILNKTNHDRNFKKAVIDDKNELKIFSDQLKMLTGYHGPNTKAGNGYYDVYVHYKTGYVLNLNVIETRKYGSFIYVTNTNKAFTNDAIREIVLLKLKKQFGNISAQ